MRRFTQLYCELEETNRTNEKVAAIEKSFRETPPADAAWGLQFLIGRLFARSISTRQMREAAAGESGLPMWIIDQSYDAVGDLGETLASILPFEGPGTSLPLAEFVTTRLKPLGELPANARRELLIQVWRELNATQRLVWNKLITGSFRIGVASTLVIRALAQVAGVEQAIMAHRVMGRWDPAPDIFQRLLAGEGGEGEEARPYPFFLASPLEAKIKTDGDIGSALGELKEWQVEWKWDGIRAQLIRRGGQTILWSRGEEMIDATFPEIVEAGNSLPEGTVLDGEVLAWDKDRPLPFARLQRRLGRKQVEGKVRTSHPVAFVTYDVLEWEGKDERAKPQMERRELLEKIVATVEKQCVERPSSPRVLEMQSNGETPMFDLFAEPVVSSVPGCAIKISPLVQAATWEELTALRQESRARQVEGFMLKRLDSPYGVGRTRGDWWKWKIDPYVIDAVLIYAQRGNGRRASLFTDYTFALKENGALVPVAKAYSGLTDEEIREVDRFIRQNTVEEFGPVRVVKPELVFELAFEGIQVSSRHKAGVAVRFPRMNRWRKDKKAEEADTLDTLRAMAARTNV